jgi:hypothetical protein
MLVLSGCSLVLGIDDPKSRIDGGTPPPDVVTISTDVLKFSLTDFTFAQGQTVRLHVVLMHKDGTMGDVTQQAIYTSDNESFATIGGKGLINGGSQAGAATITASLGDAMPATLKATTTTATCHPVINELMTGGAMGGSDEFVEIYNPCTTAINVAGWTLDYRGAMITGATGDALMIMLTGQMDPGTFRVYAGAAYQGIHDDTFKAGTGLGATDGAVGLRSGDKDTLTLMDSIAYGNVSLAPKHPFIETTPITAMTIGKSASRQLFDGNDNNDNVNDFLNPTTPTPGKLNIP